jgi:prepilin-type N-terminal cleavage/methylation domain-containing protein
MMIKSLNQHSNQGFTLIELLVAAVIGLITVMAGGQALVSQIDSSQKMSRRERLRTDWVAANQFITSEVNRSQKVTTEVGDELLDECGIESSQIKMVIQFHRNRQIKPAIYYTTENEGGWSSLLLKRCGPAINSSGDYDTTLSNEIIIDKLKNNGSGFTASIVDEKLVQFNIALNGLVNTRYQQQGAARSRIQTVIVRPNTSSVCFQDSQRNIDGIKINLTSGSDQFTSDQDQWNQQTNGDALICGHGGGDRITGGSGNNLIEAGGFENSILDGGDGNDRIIGSDGNDVIDGGDGDDILIGLGGNDILRGGSGNNHFISGIDDISDSCDHDQIIGIEDSYNIIYFEQNKDKYKLSNPCSQSSCRVTKKNTNDKKNVDIAFGNVLAFADEIVHLSQGGAGNLLPLDRDSCDVQVSVQEPPEPPEPEVSVEDDPRWLPLIEGKTIGFNIMNDLAEEYTNENRESFLENWRGNIFEKVEALPEDVKGKFCFIPRVDPYSNARKGDFHQGLLWISRKINNRCTANGDTGNLVLGTRNIFSDTESFTPFASLRLPKEGDSFRFCNLHYKTYSNSDAEARLREADGC